MKKIISAIILLSVLVFSLSSCTRSCLFFLGKATTAIDNKLKSDEEAVDLAESYIEAGEYQKAYYILKEHEAVISSGVLKDYLARFYYVPEKMTLKNADGSVVTMTYSYNEKNLPKEIVSDSSDIGTVTYTYDDAGRIIVESSDNGRKITYSYDTDGNVIEEALEYAGALETVLYQYEKKNCIEMNTPVAKYNYYYDNKGNVQKTVVFDKVSSTHKTVEYTNTYNMNGKINTVSFADGNRSVVYSYTYTDSNLTRIDIVETIALSGTLFEKRNTAVVLTYDSNNNLSSMAVTTNFKGSTTVEVAYKIIYTEVNLTDKVMEIIRPIETQYLSVN